MIPIQGNSLLATPAKQDGLTGMFTMLSMMRKNCYKPLIFADFYCGSGENVVKGEPIKGSPISMLEGIASATAKMKEIPRQPRRVVFNDIVSGRVMDQLPNAVEAWQEEMGLPVNRNMLSCYNKSGNLFTVPIHYSARSAQELCGNIFKALCHGHHVIAVIDPNGPKDAPWDELRHLYNAHGRDLEMIIHISANTLKRVSRASAATSLNFAPMPDHINDMMTAFNGCGGWIREPLGRDQWTMMLLSRFPPRNGWSPSKGGPNFLKIDTDEGQHLMHLLSTTAKERQAIAGDSQ